jgi:hypothetical protein
MRYPILLSAVLLVTILSCLAVTEAAAGQDDSRFLYQWIDDSGNVNITDNLQNVPQKFRSRAKRMEQPAAGAGNTSIQVQQQPAAEPERGTAAEDDDLKKAEWQQRMYDAKRRQEAAEKRYGELEQRKMEITSQWGSSGAALAPQTVLDEIDRINAEIERTRKDVDRAKEQVQVTIPDEARKAGIPPGWLREVQ